MAAVLVMAVLMPVLWFGLWVPILVSIARARGMRPGQAAALSVLGPIGALVAFVISRESDTSQNHFDL